MFALPSMWNLIISTFAFILAAWYARRWLDEQGIPHGMTRGILVFALASIVSWGAGEAVDWTHDKIEGPQHTAQAPSEINQLLNAAGQIRQ
jgi:hypothetical protein